MAATESTGLSLLVSVGAVYVLSTCTGLMVIVGAAELLANPVIPASFAN